MDSVEEACGGNAWIILGFTAYKTLTLVWEHNLHSIKFVIIKKELKTLKTKKLQEARNLLSFGCICPFDFIFIKTVT